MFIQNKIQLMCVFFRGTVRVIPHMYKSFALWIQKRFSLEIQKIGSHLVFKNFFHSGFKKGSHSGFFLLNP